MGFICFLTRNKRHFESRRCGFLSFRLPSAANLRRFHRLIPPQAVPISNVPQRGRSYFLYNYSLRAKKELPLRGSWHGVAVTEGVIIVVPTSSLFEGVELAARCAELLPSAFGRHLPLRGRSYFLYNYFLRSKKAPSSRELSAKLTEGVRRARDARPYNVVGKK